MRHIMDVREEAVRVALEGEVDRSSSAEAISASHPTCFLESASTRKTKQLATTASAPLIIGNDVYINSSSQVRFYVEQQASTI